MQWHDLGLGLIAFVSEVLGTASGFGSSTFFVPAATYLESFHLVLALTALLHVLSNSTRIFLFRNHMPLKELIRLAVPAIAFTAVGAALTSYLPINFLRISLGVVLLGVSVSHYIFSFRLSKNGGAAVAALSGFFTGLVGTGGAIRAAALRSMQLEKGAFVFASTVIDFGGDVVRAGIYLKQGYMDWQQWYYLPILAIAAVLGVFVGKAVLAKVPQATFEKVVSVLIFLSGISLILGTN